MRKCVGLCLSLVFFAGCLPTTSVLFKSPTGTKMQLGMVEYDWPKQIEFKRPAGRSGARIYPVTLTLPASLGGGKLKGEIQIPAVTIDDGLVCAEVNLRKKDVEQINKGKTLLIQAKGAGTDKIVCQVVLKADK